MTQALIGDNQTRPELPSLPVSGQDIAPAPREERRSVKKLAQFIWKQYQNGLSLRRHHAVAWIMVKSFLKGIHYFEIDASGGWRPIPYEPGTVRAVVPIVMPMYRHVLGLLNANELGFFVSPVAGSDKPIYKADRAKDILSAWRDETDFRSTFDRANQYLLSEGMVGYHRYVDTFRKQVYMQALPASELFPIPFDARCPGELHGLIHATLVTKQWLELQDEIYERTTGSKPNPPMAVRAKQLGMTMRTDMPLGGTFGQGGKVDGALALTVWLRKNEQVPSGEYLFMLGDEAYRHIVGSDENGPLTRSVMADGEIPVEIVYDDKDPNDFWGYGLCESQIPAQLSINRQMTAAEVNARRNRGLTFVDTDQVDIKDLQDEDAPAIPMRPKGIDLSDRKRVAEHFPPTSLGRDAYALIELHRQFADHAAGFRSGISFGVQEGRTEGGPATSLLNQNAMASLNSVLMRINEGLTRSYSPILDMLRKVWPEDKVIRVIGPGNMGREFRVQRDEMPWSSQVIIKAAPLLAGGRQVQANVLFELKKTPGPDGKPGTEISSKEFRQGLMELNLLPPGVDLSDRAASRSKLVLTC